MRSPPVFRRPLNDRISLPRAAQLAAERIFEHAGEHPPEELELEATWRHTIITDGIETPVPNLRNLVNWCF